MSRTFSVSDRVVFRDGLFWFARTVANHGDYRRHLLELGDVVKSLGCPGDGVAETLFVAFTSPEGWRYWASGGGLFKISLHQDDPFKVQAATPGEWFIEFVKAEAFTRQVAAALR